MKSAFSIEYDDAIIADLKDRLANTRWTDEVGNDQWIQGTDETYLRELCHYWQHEFNWHEQVIELNQFPQFMAEVDGQQIHFIHAQGKGKTNIPILLIHGWPDSFSRFLKVIPLLTEANENDIAFNVVVPSIPGFAFSGKPTSPGMNPKKIAALFGKLMTKELSYNKFIVHGGDWGSSITEQIARQYPKNLYGVHLTDIPWHHLFDIPKDDLTKEEKEYMAKGQQWSQVEGAYGLIQGTKPQSLGYGLNDSPAGLAAWIVEKFYRWSDIDGNLENSFTKNELLTNLTIYWITETINSANRLYWEAQQQVQEEKQKAEKNKDRIFQRIDVPTGVTIFPNDIMPAPRKFGERVFNIISWNEMKKGGHFAAMEVPELFANELRAFAHKLNIQS